MVGFRPIRSQCAVLNVSLRTALPGRYPLLQVSNLKAVGLDITYILVFVKLLKTVVWHVQS